MSGHPELVGIDQEALYLAAVQVPDGVDWDEYRPALIARAVRGDDPVRRSQFSYGLRGGMNGSNPAKDKAVLVASCESGVPDLTLLKRKPAPKRVKATSAVDGLEAVRAAAAEVARLRKAEAKLRQAVKDACQAHPVSHVAKAAGVSRQRIYQVAAA